MTKIKKLAGYQSTTPESFEKGATIGIGGDIYNIFDFNPDYITKERAAQSICKQCRYLGNIGSSHQGIMTVGQHSYQLAYAFLIMGDPIKAKQALYHDTAEGIISDISSPMKRQLQMKNGEDIAVLEHRIEEKIMHKFGVKFPYDNDVMTADKNIAQLEMSVMIKDYIFSDYWTPEKAYNMWFEMDNMIENAMHYMYKSMNITDGTGNGGEVKTEYGELKASDMLEIIHGVEKPIINGEQITQELFDKYLDMGVISQLDVNYPAELTPFGEAILQKHRDRISKYELS